MGFPSLAQLKYMPHFLPLVLTMVLCNHLLHQLELLV